LKPRADGGRPNAIDQSMVLSNCAFPSGRVYANLADAARSPSKRDPQVALDAAAARWDELTEKLSRSTTQTLQDSAMDM
jgi:hypothetical protein